MTSPTVRSQERTDDEAVLSILQSSYPEFPHGTVEDYRSGIRNCEKHGRTCRRWVAERKEGVVGCALLLEIVSTQPDLFWVEAAVPPQYRAGGIGTRLFEALHGEARNLGAKRLLGEVPETSDAGKRFTKKHGFGPNDGHGEQLSRLDVEFANAVGFDCVEQALSKKGLRIECLADLSSEGPETLQELYRLDMDTHRDVPSPVEWADIPFEEWFDVVLNGPGRSPEWAWVARDGIRLVAVARLRLYGAEAAHNAYTGVHADYRGRGIARALKFKTVAWCREKGIRYIYTSNSVENNRMLAINRSLGYVPLPRTIEVVREL